MNISVSKERGFTIIELLVVIVVIAILAAISIVSYSGIQQRARDSQRLSDMNTISTALKLYAAEKGSFPEVSSTGGAWAWEVSNTSGGPTNFLSPLKTSNVISSVPTEPSRNPIQDTTSSAQPYTPSSASRNYLYFYYTYPAGSNGCPVAKGAYYVLGATRMDTVSSGQKHPQSPGFSCAGGRSWQTDGSWVTGGFIN